MSRFYKKFKHILEYGLFIVFTRSLKLLGFKNSARLCSFLARIIGPYLGVTKIARKNLSSIYKQRINIDATIDELWDNFGRYIGEFPFIRDLSEAEIKQIITIEGLEKINYLKQRRQPFLMFLGHQANWDLVIRIISQIYPQMGVVYRKANNPYVDKEILDTRAKDDSVYMIAKGSSGVRSLIKSIKSGHSITMLVDQKMNDGIEVPFFGRPAMTANAIAKLALQYDYPLVGCQIVRTKESKFKVIIHPPLEVIKTGNMEKDSYNIMLQINQLLEKWIRQHPGQWFWFHNRWKD